jgi:hypothetical protein
MSWMGYVAFMRGEKKYKFWLIKCQRLCKLPRSKWECISTVDLTVNVWKV